MAPAPGSAPHAPEVPPVRLPAAIVVDGRVYAARTVWRRQVWRYEPTTMERWT